MQPTNHQYWNEALKRYASKDWVDKPTIFAEQVALYLPKTGSLLELAAGQGQDSRYFARLGYQVTATDLVDIGLREAQQKAEEENLKIVFQTLDLAFPLPFLDNSFDIVYSHLGLHYLDKIGTEKMFKEIHRVLKPGGTLASLFNTIDDPEIRSSGFEKVEENYYKEIAFDFKKRYFSVEDTEKYINGLFIPLLLDNKGETYKDEIKTLVRLVAQKI
jgi:SAM-dependent methyltransferase